MECVRLAGAVVTYYERKSGSKLHALHTLREVVAAAKIVAGHKKAVPLQKRASHF